MSSALLPPAPESGYRGSRISLWILGFILFVKLVTGCASIFNGYQAASSADGFPLHEYSPQGAQAVVALFGTLGSTQVMIVLLGVTILIRYRALVPLFLLFLALEFAVRKGVALMHPVARAPGNAGFWVNWSLFFLMVLALALSLRKRANA